MELYSNERNETSNSLVPSTLLAVRKIQDHESGRLLRVLLDTGASASMIQSSCLPVGATPSLLPHRVRTQTTAGTFDTSRYVDLQGLILPEFDKQKQVASVQAFLFNAPC